MEYTPETFFKDTIAVFDECDTPPNSPGFISDSGSRYWYTDAGVYRYSNHWGEFRSVAWALNVTHERSMDLTAKMDIINSLVYYQSLGCKIDKVNLPKRFSGNEWLCGFCSWDDFSPTILIEDRFRNCQDNGGYVNKKFRDAMMKMDKCWDMWHDEQLTIQENKEVEDEEFLEVLV